MMTRKRSPRSMCRLAASLVAVGSLLLCAMGVSHAAQPAGQARAMTRVTLVLKWVPQAQFAGYYIALKKGYYAREGLDVRIQPGGPDIVPESVVENGGGTFCLDLLPPLFAQREHGPEVVPLAPIFSTASSSLIVVKNARIKNA